MMKFLICLFLVVALMGLVSAECIANNDFGLNEEANVCAIGCKYQNESDTTQFIDCDSSVSCKFSAFYPNGTSIVINQVMDLDGQTLNYSLGNTTTDLGSTKGIYTGQIFCERDKGWMPPIYFQFSVSEGEITTLGGGMEAPAMTGSFLEQLKVETVDEVESIFKKYGMYFFLPLVIVLMIVGDRVFRGNKSFSKRWEREMKKYRNNKHTLRLKK